VRAKPTFKLIKFIQPYAEYRAGELAQFRDWLADRLIAEGIAVAVNMEELPE
jgi:hypothetical protein